MSLTASSYIFNLKIIDQFGVIEDEKPMLSYV